MDATRPAPFVGRTKEMRRLRQMLSAPGSVVEIIGPPGIGKTSLVRQVAADQKLFPGGVESMIAWGGFGREGAIEAVAERLQARRRGEHTLVVIDDAEIAPPEFLKEVVDRLAAGPWSLAFALTTRLKRGIGHVLKLQPLPKREVAEILSLINQHLGGARADELASLSEGSPLLAALLAEFSRGRDLSVRDLRGLLSPFESPGLVDARGQPLGPQAPAGRRLIESVREVNDAFLRRAADDPDFVFQIDPRKFEELIAELLSRRGYNVTLTPQTRDGGKDIYAAKHDELGSFLYIVECKRYSPERGVGVEVVRALHGTADAERANGAIVMTTSYFSSEARAFAARLEQRMNLRDYLELRAWLQRERPA